MRRDRKPRDHEIVTGAVVAGTVTITGSTAGPTGTPLTTTFIQQRIREFDPERRIYVTELVDPTMTVDAAGYVPAVVPVSFYQPQLRVTVDQTWLPVGRPAQVTVRAVDAQTGAVIHERSTSQIAE